MSKNIDHYWMQYLASIPDGQPKPNRYIKSFSFGFNVDDARAIAPLVLNGTKTATGSVLWSYEADGEALPIVGNLWMVTLGGDDPVCIIETTNVEIIPFDEVGADYAWEGGEEDRSVTSWRAIYWEYIERESSRLHRQPDLKAPLVMERFRVVYKNVFKKISSRCR